MDRREWLGTLLAGGVGAMLDHCAAMARGAESNADRALISITLDLEMSRNFPDWEDTHWDYEKGNLNQPTKEYAVEAARRVRAAGGVLHFFVVGQVLEQPNVDWLADIAEAGHPLGNHTYDHVNVTASSIETLQYRFRRAPWLLRGRSTSEAIRENVRLCELAMESRLGVRPAGFRTPGGFANGLHDHPEVRTMLRELGYEWASSLYPRHSSAGPGVEPSESFFEELVAAQQSAQPFVYDDGLVEVPMSPISDIGAFRTGRWQLEWFLEAVGRAIDWAIAHGKVFDFLGHPSCLYVVDPEFQVIDLICERVQQAGEKAAIVDLGALAERGRATSAAAN